MTTNSAPILPARATTSGVYWARCGEAADTLSLRTLRITDIAAWADYITGQTDTAPAMVFPQR